MQWCTFLSHLGLHLIILHWAFLQFPTSTRNTLPSLSKSVLFSIISPDMPSSSKGYSLSFLFLWHSLVPLIWFSGVTIKSLKASLTKQWASLPHSFGIALLMVRCFDYHMTIKCLLNLYLQVGFVRAAASDSQVSPGLFFVRMLPILLPEQIQSSQPSTSNELACTSKNSFETCILLIGNESAARYALYSSLPNHSVNAANSYTFGSSFVNALNNISILFGKV